MTSSIKFIVAAVAGLTATVAVAGEGQHSFTHDGYTYVYTADNRDGATIIDGRRMPGGRTFHYIVKNGRVRGGTGGQPVAFTTADAKGATRGKAQVIGD